MNAKTIVGSSRSRRLRSAPATGSARWVRSVAAGHGEQYARCGVQRQGEKKLLYYRNPIGLPDTSPTPKKIRWGWTTSPCTRARSATVRAP